MLSLPCEVSVLSVVDVVLDADVALVDDSLLLSSVVVDEVFDEASVVEILDAVDVAVVDDSLLVSLVVVDAVVDEASVVVVLDVVSPSDLFILRRAFALDSRASKDHFWYT